MCVCGVRVWGCVCVWGVCVCVWMGGVCVGGGVYKMRQHNIDSNFAGNTPIP